MSLYIIRKRVYYSSVYRCDQGIADTLSLASTVSDKFKEDHPNIRDIYAKSDNASSYHRNFVLEALHKLCLSKNIHLKQYDYNEPACGKDQCDRESAGAKSLIQSYVDAGHDLVSAEDVADALKYGSGLKNSAVSVVSIEKSAARMGTKIQKIKSFHSFECNELHMKVWRYFNLGQGLVRPYNNADFVPAITVIQPFLETENKIQNRATSSSTRYDRQLCSLHFCPEYSCKENFQTESELEQHLLTGKHTISCKVSIMDQVKKSFIYSMKRNSSLASLDNLDDIRATSARNNSETTMQYFSPMGWALPVKKKTKFSQKQRTMLFELFMQGEESGKKVSAEQAHLMLRKKLEPDEYVTSQQIRSLFPRWSQMKQDNTLTVTTQADPEDDDCSLEYEGLFKSIRKVYDQSITRCMFQCLKRNWNMVLVHWHTLLVN